MYNLVSLLLLPTLLSAQLLYQVPESLSPDDVNSKSGLPPVKRTYVLHRGPDGEPRYTSLVRRNFLRFGKRNGGLTPQQEKGEMVFNSEIPQEEGSNRFEKRARDYLRFGKREDHGNSDYLDFSNENLATPSKRFGRRRISNFLRFG